VINDPPLSTSSPVLSSAELAYLRTLCAEPSPFARSATTQQPVVRIQPSLALYATDLLSMARHFAELDGTLLTRRVHEDLNAYARARRVIRGDGSGTALVRAAVAEVRAVVREATSMTSLHAAATSGGDTDEGPLGGGTVRESGDWLHVGGKSVLTGDDYSSVFESNAERAEVWEVSDAEMRAAFPAVVRHRVRMRDGPEDEILGSLVFPATKREARPPGTVDDRRTVEEVLQDILEDRNVSVIA
jgi:hypothetical protein